MSRLSTASIERCSPGAVASEWPTWLLVPVVYAAWAGAVLGVHRLGPVLGTVALTLATCWFTSLQHELTGAN